MGAALACVADGGVRDVAEVEGGAIAATPSAPRTTTAVTMGSADVGSRNTTGGRVGRQRGRPASTTGERDRCQKGGCVAAKAALKERVAELESSLARAEAELWSTRVKRELRQALADLALAKQREGTLRREMHDVMRDRARFIAAAKQASASLSDAEQREAAALERIALLCGTLGTLKRAEAERRKADHKAEKARAKADQEAIRNLDKAIEAVEEEEARANEAEAAAELARAEAVEARVEVIKEAEIASRAIESRNQALDAMHSLERKLERAEQAASKRPTKAPGSRTDEEWARLSSASPRHPSNHSAL